jgi:GTP cyclohydrolase IB
MKTLLKDVQNQKDTREVDIQQVGVKDVEIPLIIQRKGAENQVVSAVAKMSVSLPKDYKGTHMSRFIEVLSEWKTKNLLGVDIRGCLNAIKNNLEAKSAYLKFNFKYFIDKKSPITQIASPMGYDCFFEGTLNKEDYNFTLGVNVPVTTLCPCSKEISDLGAHNQRAIIKVKISFDEKKLIWIEDLIDEIEKCGSCPVYPLLKREDEKFVTETAYQNPKFVEDVLRDVVVMLRKNKFITKFSVECEAFESIHNHSAWAFQTE